MRCLKVYAVLSSNEFRNFNQLDKGADSGGTLHNITTLRLSMVAPLPTHSTEILDQQLEKLTHWACQKII